MRKEKVRKEKAGLTDLSNLNDLDLPTGYICDVETGICGPVDELENEKIEEKKE